MKSRENKKISAGKNFLKFFINMMFPVSLDSNYINSGNITNAWCYFTQNLLKEVLILWFLDPFLIKRRK
jgi:hypothetical protein